MSTFFGFLIVAVFVAGQKAGIKGADVLSAIMLVIWLIIFSGF